MKKVFTHTLIPKRPPGFLPLLGGMLLFTSFLVHAQECTVIDEGYQPLMEGPLSMALLPTRV